MRNTTNWGLTVPSAGTDPDDIPTHVGTLGDQLDAALGSAEGTLANRPTTGKAGQFYYVNSGTNAGALYRWSAANARWDLVNGSQSISSGSSTDVKTLSWSDTPSAGTASKGFAPIDHDHGTPANPVTAHVAASNPHPQYELSADAASQLTRYKNQFLLGGM